MCRFLSCCLTLSRGSRATHVGILVYTVLQEVAAHAHIQQQQQTQTHKATDMSFDMSHIVDPVRNFTGAEIITVSGRIRAVQESLVWSKVTDWWKSVDLSSWHNVDQSSMSTAIIATSLQALSWAAQTGGFVIVVVVIWAAVAFIAYHVLGRSRYLVCSVFNALVSIIVWVTSVLVHILGAIDAFMEHIRVDLTVAPKVDLTVAPVSPKVSPTCKARKSS